MVVGNIAQKLKNSHLKVVTDEKFTVDVDHFIGKVIQTREFFFLKKLM